MAGYRIEPTRAFADEFHRIAGDVIRECAELCERKDADAAILGLRKRIKKLRALIRLVRAADKKRCTDIDSRLRKLSRALSASRDAAAARETAERIKIQDGMHEPGPVDDWGGTRSGSRLELEAMAASLRSVRLPDKTPKTARLIGTGAARSRLAGWRRLNKAFASDDAAIWHHARTAIKRHWLHLRLIEAAWPEALAGQAAAMHRMAKLLGEDHDLNLLEADAEGRAAIAARQTEIRAEVRQIAEPFMTGDPSLDAERFEALWRIASHRR